VIRTAPLLGACWTDYSKSRASRSSAKLVRYHIEDVSIKEAWSAPAELQLFRHVIADVARLPVLEIVSGHHFVANLTLGYCEVVFDYLAKATRP
jgi:acetoacetate decarboxylase